MSKAEAVLVDHTGTTPEERQAEEIAARYAVGAATVDYRDFDAWAERAKAGTTPELSARLDSTNSKVRAIITPLQWVATPTLMAAKVVKAVDGVFTVDVFLDLSTTTKGSQPNRTTIYYILTVDRGAQWQITEVNGTGMNP